jgi:hypothetical protein
MIQQKKRESKIKQKSVKLRQRCSWVSQQCQGVRNQWDRKSRKRQILWISRHWMN